MHTDESGWGRPKYTSARVRLPGLTLCSLLCSLVSPDRAMDCIFTSFSLTKLSVVHEYVRFAASFYSRRYLYYMRAFVR